MTVVSQHFVSGSQANGVDKGTCDKRATSSMLGLTDPAVCDRHARFWRDRGFTVVDLEPM